MLPEMAARLGFRYGGYQPTKGLSMQEEFDLISKGVYPAEAQIDSAEWWALHDYIIALAPDTLTGAEVNLPVTADLGIFTPSKVTFPDNVPSRITALQFEEETAQFIIGLGSGSVYRWPVRAARELDTFAYRYPITSNFRQGNDSYVTEVGILNPNEAAFGILHRFGPGTHDTLVTKLKRAVYTEVIDLNQDGREEILICEYGNRLGQLSLFREGLGGELEGKVLYDGPGSIRTQVADLNNDGLLDIIALTAQGDEGVTVFYQQPELTFKRKQLVRQPAVYGSSWFELFDYEGDGDLDLVVVNGDNADYSNILKPYHGMRLFLNDGQQKFTEVFFFPLHGCTRVVGHDFDQDGDIDFALTAFFADWQNNPASGFVYLENKDAVTFNFLPQTTQMAALGRWLLLEKGDYDQDGDMDITLGSFLLSPGKQHAEIMKKWMVDPVNLLVLENKLKSDSR